LWAPINILNQIPDKNFLIKKSNFYINSNYFIKFLWCFIFMKKELQRNNISLLFVLNGINFSRFSNYVGISQNLLPFNKRELLKLLNKPFFLLKLILIRYLQLYSYKKSDGFIFLNSYAQSIFKSLSSSNSKTIVIPHGVNRQEIPVKVNFDLSNQINILSISPIEKYKNYNVIIPALKKFNDNNNRKIHLTIIGSYESGYSQLKKIIRRLNLESFVHFKGRLAHNDVIKILHKYDFFIFSSSCENFPITLLEAAAANVPILCSNIQPMPEILNNNAIFFNPYDSNSIYKSFDKITNLNQISLMLNNARKALNKYNWNVTTIKTFNFLNKFTRGK